MSSDCVFGVRTWFAAVMRAVLEASGDAERKVWVVDSFEGCPVPNEEEYPVDSGDKHHTFQNLVSHDGLHVVLELFKFW